LKVTGFLRCARSGAKARPMRGMGSKVPTDNARQPRRCKPNCAPARQTARVRSGPVEGVALAPSLPKERGAHVGRPGGAAPLARARSSACAGRDRAVVDHEARLRSWHSPSSGRGCAPLGVAVSLAGVAARIADLMVGAAVRAGVALAAAQQPIVDAGLGYLR